MKILYFNNCWFTNVGEAFIDIGTMKMLELIFPNKPITNVSVMTQYYVKQSLRKSFESRKSIRNKIDNVYNMLANVTADYLVLAGMCATEEFANSMQGELVARMSERGIKIIFLGLGGIAYNESEKIIFSKYLERVKPLLITTRDKVTYRMYHDIVENCISAIDCAMWVSDIYKPQKISTISYDIVSFNRLKEPKKIEGKDKKIEIVRPYHFQNSFTKKIIKKGTFLSDSPYDYLTVYANANKVYTDLLHATLISLAYAIPVRYYFYDKRSYAFDALENLGEEDGMLVVSIDSLDEQKKKIIENIKKVINIVW